VLKDHGAKKVYAYCTHPIFSGPAIERIAQGAALDEVVVTNTIPLSEAARGCAKIRQLSVAPLIAETIQRIAKGDSVMSCLPTRTTCSDRANITQGVPRGAFFVKRRWHWSRCSSNWRTSCNSSLLSAPSRARVRAAACAIRAVRPASSMALAAQPVAIELDHNALWHALKKEAFHSSVLDMELDGKTSKVLLRDVQYHPFKQLVLHIDFQRVDEKKKKKN
jgi:ribosomal protein L25 (general stress protein Ctc)